MKLPNGKCSYEQNRLKHVSWFDKLMAAQKERIVLIPDEPQSKPSFERDILKGQSYDNWAYDNLLITYEELKERKNNGKV